MSNSWSWSLIFSLPWNKYKSIPICMYLSGHKYIVRIREKYTVRIRGKYIVVRIAWEREREDGINSSPDSIRSEESNPRARACIQLPNTATDHRPWIDALDHRNDDRNKALLANICCTTYVCPLHICHWLSVIVRVGPCDRTEPSNFKASKLCYIHIVGITICVEWFLLLFWSSGHTMNGWSNCLPIRGWLCLLIFFTYVQSDPIY
jgi:hypothetical protein